MGETLSFPLKKILQERRKRLNSFFLQARVSYPRLSGDTFLPYLRDTLIPIVEKVYAYDSSRVVVVLDTLYQISLKLVAQELMGPRARNRGVEESWRDILSAHPALLCQEPLLVATSVNNALLHLAGIDPQKTAMWKDVMQSLGAFTNKPEDWLKAGQVAAWRCGLAHYRASALATAKTLESSIGSKAIGLPDSLDHNAYQALLLRLANQPWVRPEEWLTGGPSKSEVKLFAWTGGFVGFGGYFASPPKPYLQDGQIFLRDDSNAWYLAADCFGVTLVRAQLASLGNVDEEKSFMTVRNDGTVDTVHGKFLAKAAEKISSYAASKTTVAIVPKDSHKVAVLGLRISEAYK